MSRDGSGEDWTQLVVAMDRGLRVFADFARPVLVEHDAVGLSLSNLLFLISIGDEEVRVNDIVRRGRYLASNASYALKALQENGFIDRHQDPHDRRNAIITYTERGHKLSNDLRVACRTANPALSSVLSALQAFEGHCARLPVISDR